MDQQKGFTKSSWPANMVCFYSELPFAWTMHLIHVIASYCANLELLHQLMSIEIMWTIQIQQYMYWLLADLFVNLEVVFGTEYCGIKFTIKTSWWMVQNIYRNMCKFSHMGWRGLALRWWLWIVLASLDNECVGGPVVCIRNICTYSSDLAPLTEERAEVLPS